jgi:prophage DNA circulation protein
MIQEARYTSPSGEEAVFSWEKGKRKTTLKTGVYTFPGRDGAHVQHQGAGDRIFPLVCIFSGPDCMEKADAFEAMLIERGTAELQHPLYGTLKVVPTGDIEREDDPVNKNGESTVTITFTETIDDEEAAGLNEVAAEAIDEKFEEFSEAAATDFAETLAAAGDDAANLSDQLAIQAALEAQTQSIIDNLEPLAKVDKKKFSEWIASAKELKDKIKNLYKKGMSYAGKVESLYVKALNIARLTLRLMKLPSDIFVSLAEKIKGYSNLTANLINQYKNDPFGVEKIKNAYATASLAITGAVAAIASGSALTVAEVAAMTGATSRKSVVGYGSAASIGGDTGGGSGGGGSGGGGSGGGGSGGGGSGGGGSGGGGSGGGGSGGGGSGSSSGGIGSPGSAVSRSAGTASREEAVEAANMIAAFMETATEFQDSKIAQNAFVDTDTAAALSLNELVYTSIQLILNTSFALPMQKTITLDRDRQVIELCAELYGSTDYLDDFIIENNLNIDEIELLPMGKKVSYYVKST